MVNVRSAILVAGMLVVPAVGSVQATPMPAIAMPQAPSASVIEVRDHGHHHGHHRRDHRSHGRDDDYARDDENGMLFKSFITGTLFR